MHPMQKTFWKSLNWFRNGGPKKCRRRFFVFYITFPIMSKTLVENLLFDKKIPNLKSGRIFPKLGGQKLPFSQAMNLETEWQKLKNSGCESIMAKCLFQSGGLLSIMAKCLFQSGGLFSKNSSKSQILPNFWQNVQSGGLFNWTFSEWSQVPGHVLVDILEDI